MVFEKLEENYTKVTYAKSNQSVVNKVLPSTQYRRYLPTVLPIMLLSGAVYFNLDDLALATDFTKKAERLYFDKFMALAKWVIIIKGGWDIISKTLKEDFEGAKKCIVQYLVVFVTLMGLPHALNFVEDFFKEGI